MSYIQFVGFVQKTLDGSNTPPLERKLPESKARFSRLTSCLIERRIVFPLAWRETARTGLLRLSSASASVTCSSACVPCAAATVTCAAAFVSSASTCVTCEDAVVSSASACVTCAAASSLPHLPVSLARLRLSLPHLAASLASLLPSLAVLRFWIFHSKINSKRGTIRILLLDGFFFNKLVISKKRIITAIKRDD